MWFVTRTCFIVEMGLTCLFSSTLLVSLTSCVTYWLWLLEAIIHSVRDVGEHVITCSVVHKGCLDTKPVGSLHSIPCKSY